MHLQLKISSVTSVHIFSNNTFIAVAGVVASDLKTSLEFRATDSGAILRKAINTQEEIYLPDLQILPGKVEFSYLPINCQSLLIIPVSQESAVILGTNKAKALKLGDLKSIRTAITIIDSLL